MTPEQRIARLEHLAEIMFEDEIRNRGNRRARHIWDAIHRERLDRAVEVWEAAQPPTSDRAMLWAQVEERRGAIRTYGSQGDYLMWAEEAVKRARSSGWAHPGHAEALLDAINFCMSALEQAGTGEST
jgi:hypothetical protein